MQEDTAVPTIYLEHWSSRTQSIMPTIQVDDSGRQLYYEDTGPPENSRDDYLTIVILHGLLFHGGKQYELSLGSRTHTQCS